MSDALQQAIAFQYGALVLIAAFGSSKVTDDVLLAYKAVHWMNPLGWFFEYVHSNSIT